MTEESESDIGEMRVNIRWGRAQVDTLKRAASLYGVPYQTYAKQAAMRQAIADLRAAFPAMAWLPLNESNVPRAVLNALEGKPDFETVVVDGLTYIRVSGQVAVAVPDVNGRSEVAAGGPI
jgi:hypothetical protein